MMRGTTRWARRALVLCAAAAVVGCDDFGEKQALDVQAEASAIRSAGGASADDALAKLSAAANATGTSAAVIQAQTALAQVQAAKADSNAVDLARLGANASATVFRIGQLARQARMSLTLAGNYTQLNPRLGVEQFADYTAKARGDNNVEAYPIDEAKIPTLAIAKQNKSRLEGEIAKTQEQSTVSTATRDKLLASAGTAASAVESQTGAERSATVKQMAGLRGQAAEASRKMSDLTSTLTRAQADLAEQNGLVAQLQVAVDTMSAQGASLTSGWDTMKGKAADQTALAKKIVDGEGDSIRSLTKSLNEQLKEIDTKRGETESLYKTAIDQFTKAADHAGARIAELNAARQASGPNAYETAAWDHEASLISIDRIHLDRSSAEKSLADLHARHAAWLSETLAVTEEVESVSEALNVGAADPFNGDKLKTDLGKTIATASEAYETVIATLDGVSFAGADLAPLKPAKAMSRIIALSDQASLADLAVANKVAPDVAKKASTLRKDMTAAAEEARASNTPLPMLPVSLGGMAVTKTDSATTAPATPDSPQVAEIRQSIRDLVAKFSAADASETTVDEALGRIKADESLKPILTSVRQIALSTMHLEAAVKEKFGDEGVAELKKAPTDAPASGMTSSLPTPEEIEKQIAAVKITAVDENTAELASPSGTGPAAKLVKEDGVWKVDLTSVPPQVQMVIGFAGPMLAPVVTGLDEVTADVQSGKLTTVAEVKAALEAKMKAASGGMMGGMMGGGGAATQPTTMPTPAAPGDASTPATPAAPTPTTPAPSPSAPAGVPD